MTILIADDEELVRVGLRDILLRIVPDITVYEAVNGRTMIDAVKKIPPDLCFVDIKMPGITGLEAIEQLTKTFPDICWIILSGYSDFEYARKALTLGALDYLLKPATENEVAAALEKARNRFIEAGRQKREKFEYRVGGVLNNSSAAEFDDYLIKIGRYAAMAFITGSDDDQGSMLLQRKLFAELKRKIDSESLQGCAGLFNILDGFPAVIAGGENPEELLNKLMTELPDYVAVDCRIIISPVMNSLSELLSYLERAADFKPESMPSINNDSLDKSSRIVRQAERLVLEQYNNPIGLAQIAEQLNVTPNYLSSLFKKYKHVSFTKFITDIRLNEAPKLLEIPGLTVKEAASMLGYMSSRHFSRLFREKYGTSPSDYHRK